MWKTGSGSGRKASAGLWFFFAILGHIVTQYGVTRSSMSRESFRISVAIADRTLSDEEIDRHVKELRQPLRLRLADRSPATQHFSGCAFVAQNRPDVLVFQPALVHNRIQRLVGRHVGERMVLFFVVPNEERQHFGERFLFG